MFRKKPSFNENKENSQDSLTLKLLSFDFWQWFVKERLMIILLVFLVCLVYANTLNNEFVSDDIAGILQNQELDHFSGSLSSPLKLFHSLQPGLYAIIIHLFGRIPPPFHLLNIAFHLGTVLLVFLTIYLLTDRTTAFFAAALAACHPIMTEAVTWISGGGHVMYSFFLMLAFVFYLFLVKNENYLYLSFFAFFVSLSVSEKAIIFPLILAALTISFGLKVPNWKKVLVLMLPVVIIGCAFLIAIPGRLASLTTGYQEKILLNPLWQVPIAVTSYLELILWPKNLTLYHSEMVFGQGEYLLRLAIFIIFLAGLLYSFKKNKRVFFWLAFFLISLLPTLTPFGISWIVAERYVYFGAIGIFALAGLIFSRINQKLKNLKVIYITFAIIIMVLSWRTILRNHDWQNQDTLWLAAAKTSPSSPQNHNNLGDLYGRHGDYEKAIEEFKRAIELNPEYADAFHNLANTYQQMGKIDLAIENYKKATEFNPKLWQSWQNLAAIYFEKQDYLSASQAMENAVKAKPDEAILYLNLGVIYQKLGKIEQANQAFQKAQEFKTRP